MGHPRPPVPLVPPAAALPPALGFLHPPENFSLNFILPFLQFFLYPFGHQFFHSSCCFFLDEFFFYFLLPTSKQSGKSDFDNIINQELKEN